MKKNLKAVLEDANVKYQEISKTLGIKSLSTISLKVNGKAHFTTTEATLLKNLINKKSGKNYTLEQLFE